MLAVLALVLAFTTADRPALGLVLQDIKADFSLSDTQLGLLTGIAFSLFYSIMGIPIARWADRGNRVVIIAITLSLGCGAVALCGAAASFVQLLLIRIGVAIGEAGTGPAANSLIADQFPRGQRSRATSLYMLGAPWGIAMGYFFAGWLNQFFGWRVMFMMLSLPGVGIAALAWLTLREPRHLKATTESEFASFSRWAEPGFKEVCRRLWSNITFRHLLLCYALVSFFGSGLGKWLPAFFIRSYGLTTGELGMWLTLIYGIGAGVGVYVGGELTSRYAAHDERLQLKAMTVAYCSAGVISASVYLCHSAYLGLALLGVAAVLGSAVISPLFAMVQTLVPDRMRAQSVALIYLFANLVGVGLAPLAVGAMSDVLRPWLGEASLRYALLALCPGYLWAAWHLWHAGKSVRRDLAAAHQEQDGCGSETPVVRASLTAG